MLYIGFISWLYVVVIYKKSGKCVENQRAFTKCLDVPLIETLTQIDLQYISASFFAVLVNTKIIILLSLPILNKMK